MKVGAVALIVCAGVCQAGEPLEFVLEPTADNDTCMLGAAGVPDVSGASGGLRIVGELSGRDVVGLWPDAYLIAFDSTGAILAEDNDSSPFGNGWAPALVDVDSDGDGVSELLEPDGFGGYVLRLGLTGRPDGFDGDVDGLFIAGPHQQIGDIEVRVTVGATSGPQIIERRSFTTGSEAFRLGYNTGSFDPIPTDLSFVRIETDNTVGVDRVFDDRDFYHFTNLDPHSEYVVEIEGGVGLDGLPTDVRLGWYDKNCNLILSDSSSGPHPDYGRLALITDINGEFILLVSAGSDADGDGLADSGPGVGEPHGVGGGYVLTVRRAGGSAADLNGDGVVDSSDLAILLAAWGPVP